MTKLEQIEREVRELSADELAHFREWFVAFDAVAWDRQIEADATSGKLDGLADEALADKQFALLKTDPRHPSLHFKRVKRFHSVRVGTHVRALAVDAVAADPPGHRQAGAGV